MDMDMTIMDIVVDTMIDMDMTTTKAITMEDMITIMTHIIIRTAQL